MTSINFNKFLPKIKKAGRIGLGCAVRSVPGLIVVGTSTFLLGAKVHQRLPQENAPSAAWAYQAGQQHVIDSLKIVELEQRVKADSMKILHLSEELKLNKMIR